MTSILTRRSILGGLISAMAAPAIVRAASLMPVSALAPEITIVTVGSVERLILDRALEWGVYGRSPAMDALPDLATLQQMARALETLSPDPGLARNFVFRGDGRVAAIDKPAEIISVPGRARRFYPSMS